MSRDKYIIDPAEVDYDNIVADIEQIRKFNPQRFEMEQLTAIVYANAEQMLCAGYKDRMSSGCVVICQVCH